MAIDIEGARKLIAALEADIARLPADSAQVARLRAEIAGLKSALQAAPVAHDDVHRRLHGVHGALDLVEAEGLEAGRYLAEIGRILGLS